jgi:hypothetical protein
MHGAARDDQAPSTREWLRAVVVVTGAASVAAGLVIWLVLVLIGGCGCTTPA